MAMNGVTTADAPISKVAELVVVAYFRAGEKSPRSHCSCMIRFTNVNGLLHGRFSTGPLQR